MVEISSFVFFDTETTGLPHQERNQTKIIEFSFVAAQRKDLEVTPHGEIPPVSKLTFVLNPEKSVCRKVTQMTGLSLRSLKKAPTFKEKFESIITFLKDLPPPVCLVAHNGNAFDYRILRAECNDARVSMPSDLLCADSLVGFRSILKGTNIDHFYLLSPKRTIDELITEDEDEWDDLKLTPEDLNSIEKAESQALSNITNSDLQNATPIKKKKVIKKKKRSEAIQKVFPAKSTSEKSPENEKENFRLTTIYKRLLNKDEENAHRAEGDCLMLIQCAVALKKEFLPWVDKNCKHLSSIYPLRY